MDFAIPRLVAVLLEICSVCTTLGSGMTFKFWPLFFKGDFGFSPAGVCAVQFMTWLSVAACAQVMPLVARRIGRLPTVIMSFYIGTGLLFLISRKAPVVPTLLMVLVRNAVMNGGTPIIQAVVVDMVPQQHRGKWGAIASLKRSSWSGSAFVGGELSDSHDYRFAFFITACVHSGAGLFLFPAAALLP
mmetsp:Transcript_86471/g.269078  ORF Transcript_86471/g.269078 Transcript_86471/m.269078 type:complete len:188 (-) Transcript_86471:110-673(-)